MANLKIGDPALAFDLPATDGKNYSLDSFRGKKALAVVFSCNHCPYVKAWEDRLVVLGRKYAAKGAGFVLICSNDAVRYPADSFENMKKLVVEKNYPFPYLHDRTQEVARAFGAERTPEVFLFDSAGKLCYHGAPDDNYEDPEAVKQHFLRDALEAVLAGKLAPTPSTPPVGCTIKWK